MSKKTVRNIFISIFVICWTLLYHYESTRHFYLNPLFKTDLPKTKFLFPPAGWIMFFQVGESSGAREVFGIKDGTGYFIDPHDILRTRTIGYDNIHRGILGSAAHPRNANAFCRFLKFRFPYFDNFIVKAIYYPDVSKDRSERIERIDFQCFK